MLINVVFSDGAAFTTPSRSSLRSYANSFRYRERFRFQRLRFFLKRSLSVNYGELCVVNAAPSDST